MEDRKNYPIPSLSHMSLKRQTTRQETKKKNMVEKNVQSLVLSLPDTRTIQYNPEKVLSDTAAIICYLTHRIVFPSGKVRVTRDCHVTWAVSGERFQFIRKMENDQEKIVSCGNQFVFDNVPSSLGLNLEPKYSYQLRIERIIGKIGQLYLQKRFSRMFVQLLPNFNGPLEVLKKKFEENKLALLCYNINDAPSNNSLYKMKFRQGLIVPIESAENYVLLKYADETEINNRICEKIVRPSTTNGFRTLIRGALVNVCIWYDNLSFTLLVSYHEKKIQYSHVTWRLIKSKIFLVKNLLEKENKMVMRILFAGNFGFPASMIKNVSLRSNDQPKPNFYIPDDDEKSQTIMAEWIF